MRVQGSTSAASGLGGGSDDSPLGTACALNVAACVIGPHVGFGCGHGSTEAERSVVVPWCLSAEGRGLIAKWGCDSPLPPDMCCAALLP